METKKSPNPVLPFTTYPVYLGADPELFIETDNGIAGSESIIPDEGIYARGDRAIEHRKAGPLESTDTKIKRDGVQVEFNLGQQTCRAYLANDIANCFYTLKKSMKEGMGVSPEAVIKMKKKTLDELSEESRKFGCAPSNNAYSGEVNKIKVDASRYLTRSAGGHIHFGGIYGKVYACERFTEFQAKQMHDNAEEIVRFLDTVLATTCVLIDRDPNATKRREVYGLAGDYRLPKHGLEYRTLSNFWLKHYFIYSLVFGLARTSIEIYLNDWSYEIVKDIISRHDIPKIINTNNFDKAYEVYSELRDKIFKNISYVDHFSVCRDTIHGFEKVIKNGLDFYFNFNILEHWCSLPEAHYSGANIWLKEVGRLTDEEAKKRW